MGSGAAELGHRGKAQVAQWLRDLQAVKVDAVYCSDQPQCQDPAQAIAEAKQLPLQAQAALRDQHMGDWQGRSWEDLVQAEGERIQDFFSNFGDSKAPAGESLGEAVERLLSWWTDLAPKSLGKTLVVVTSGAMITGFAAAMLGLRLSRCVSLNLPHGGMGILDCFANGVRITSWNPGALASGEVAL